MAYVQAENDPNAQQQVPGAGAPNPMAPPPSTSTGTGAGSAAAASPQGAAAVPNTSKAPPTQDLGAYLAANAPQAVQMGQNIAGNLNQQAQTVTGDINAAQTDVNNQVSAGTVAANPDLVSKAATNPTEFVQNPDDVAAFHKQLNPEYTGPANFESTPYDQNLTNEVTNAVSKAPDVTKEGGVQQLVTGQETNPTAGMTNLDTLLLQGNQEAMAPIQGALPQYGKMGDYLSGVRTSSDDAIQKAITDQQALSSGVKNQFTGAGGVVPAWQSSIVKNTKDAQTDVDAYNNQIKELTTDLNQYQPAIAAYNARPLNGSTPSIISPYSPPTPVNAVTPEQAASQKDFETEAALNELLGGNLSDLNPTLIDQAGKTGLTGESPLQTELYNLKRQYDPTTGNQDIEKLIALLVSQVTPSGTIPTPVNTKQPLPPAGPDTSTWDPANPPAGWTYLDGMGWAKLQ